MAASVACALPQTVSDYALSRNVTVMSDESDPYTSNWMFQHGLIVQSEDGGIMMTEAAKEGDPKFPMIYYPTVEEPIAAKADKTSGLKEAPEQLVTPFQVDMAPIRIRGTINKKTFDVVAQAGLSPNPTIFYKLADMKGNLNDGDISSGTINSDFYKGKIILKKTQFKGKDGEVIKGLGGFLAKVNWVGLGTKVAGALLPLIL